MTANQSGQPPGPSYAFHRLVADISARFINEPAENIDAALADSLETLGTFCGVDACWIVLGRNPLAEVELTHRWVRDGVEIDLPLGTAFSFAALPWFAERVGARDTVLVTSLDALPKAAALEREFLGALGVHTFVGLPLLVHDALLGYVGFTTAREATTWTQESLDVLRFAAHIIASALDRKRADEALRVSQDSLAQAHAIAQLGAWSVDYRTETVVWSDEVYRIMGQDPARFTPTRESYLAAVHPNDRARTLHAISGAREHGRNYELEHRIVQPDGSVRWVQAHAQVIADATGRSVGLRGTARDITAEREAWQAVRESEARYRLLAQTAPVGIFYTDSRGRANYVNENFTEMTGIRLEQMQRDGGWTEAFHPDDREVEVNRWRRALETRTGYTSAPRFLHPDGREVWTQGRIEPMYDHGGKFVGFIGALTDITGRLKADDALRASEERYRLLAERARDTIWLADSRGRFTYVSPAVTDHLGFRPDELVGRHYTSLTPPDQAERVAVALGDSQGTPRDAVPLEIQLATKAGGLAWAEVNLALVCNDAGDPIGLQGITRDIRERKHAEVELHRRAEFQRLVAALSSDFLSRTRENMDAGMAAAMEAIGAFFGVHNVRFSAAAGTADERDTYRWEAPNLRQGYRPGTQEVQALFPWIVQELLAKRVVRVADVAAMPAAAAADQAELRRQGVHAYLGVPVIYRDQALGEVGCAMFDGPREWTDDDAEQLRVLGEILMSARQRHSADQALAQLVELERLAAEISTSFINLPSDRIGAAIEDALARLGRTAGAHGAHITRYDETLDALVLTHRWKVTGEYLMPLGRTFPRKTFPVLLSELEAHRAIYVRTPDEVPAEAAAERRLLESLEAENMIVVPMVYGGRLIGSLDMTTMGTTAEWSEHVRALIRFVADVFVSAMARQHADEALANRAEFERLVAQVSTRFINLPVERIDEGIHDGLEAVGRFADVATAVVILVHEGSEELTLAYRWRREDAAPPFPVRSTFPMDDFPWLMAQLRAQRVVSIASVREMPAEAHREREFFTSAGITSALAVPLASGDRLLGALTLTVRDGTRVWSEDSAALLSFFGTVLINALERKRADDARRRLEAQFLQAQKMEAVGTLAGGLAHDFNNLLTGILGSLELGLMDLPEDSPIADLLRQAQEAGTRAAELTRQLLVLSRRQEPEMASVDVNEAVNAIGRLLQRSISETIEIRVVLDAAVPAIRADAGQLRQALLNLGINARDAMPTGGRLTLETRVVTFDERAAGAQGDARPGTFVEITLRDTGSGIPDAVRERIFEPFFTTKEQGQGTGLGLAMVYGCMHAHHGWVQVESVEGQGATFRLYLPLIVAEEPAAPRPDTPIMPRGSETILLVDDTDSVLYLGRGILERCGYRVLIAWNGEEAVEIAQAHGANIALVVTDLVMPRAGGRDLLRALREAGIHTPVMLTSGYASEGRPDTLIEEGFAAYVPKPFDASTLAVTVRNVLDSAPAVLPDGAAG